MKFRFLYVIVSMVALTSSTLASDSEIAGTWQTERGTKGGYLQVKFDACDRSLCGVIVAAFDENGERGFDYEHLGKNMVWDMRSKDEYVWTGGYIWDPEKNKSYKSKMILLGTSLEVSGCIAIFCRSQIWTKVE